MPESLRDLSRVPILIAPMGGGPSTPELVVAAAEAGALGILAAGYRSAAATAEEMASVRRATSAAFGVNVFVPGRPTTDERALTDYLAEIRGDAARHDVELAAPSWDDDDWDAKIALLLDDPVATVSFTFGCPSREIVAALQARRTIVVATVTSPQEAAIAAAAGVDALCAQGVEAGAHRGTFANEPGMDEHRLGELLALLAATTTLPVIAAGGIMDAVDVTAALAAGAVAVQCGTAFLRCDESGAHPTYKAALGDDRFTETALTRAFSGRPARGLRNAFMREHAGAPPAYPEINNATRPLRAAAARAGDADRMSLWAGEGWRRAASGPAGEVVERLARGA
jgi:nitronate monooxygenase